MAVLRWYCLKRSFGRGRHLWGNDDDEMKEGRRQLKLKILHRRTILLKWRIHQVFIPIPNEPIIKKQQQPISLYLQNKKLLNWEPNLSYIKSFAIADGGKHYSFTILKAVQLLLYWRSFIPCRKDVQ